MNSTVLITITEGQQEPYVINLLTFKKNIIKFGSRQDCDIILKMKCVSDIHGMFELNSNDVVSVNTINSDAGIYCGNNKIVNKNLRDGDVLCIKGQDINENPYNCVTISVSIMKSQNNYTVNSNANSNSNISYNNYGDTPNQSNNDCYYKKEYSGASIASMVLGIVALLLSCCIYPISIVCSVISIFLFAVSDKYKAGKGMGIAGLVCALVALIPAFFTLLGGVTIMNMLSELS